MEETDDIYYVYRYIDPRNNKPFYIGKGKKDRAFVHLNYCRNPLFNSVLNKIKNANLEPIIEFICQNVSERFALMVECAFIKYHGRRDLNEGPLCNFTDGGEGMSGISEEIRKKIGNAARNRTVSEETRKKLSDAGRNRSSEWRQSISDANKRRVVSEETKQKISNANKGKIRSEETRKKQSENAKNISEETRKKRSETMKGIVRSEETRRKMSEASQMRPIKICPHCGKEGKGSPMTRFHFENCKHKPEDA